MVEHGPEARFDEALALAAAAHRSGLDGVMLVATAAQPAPLLAATAIGAAVPDLLLAVETPIGDRHPLELAEEAAVVDQCTGGRLILVVRPTAADALEESVRLLRAAFASRPFRFEGRRWRVPANLPENVHNVERRTRLMPPPRQPRLELWITGAPVRLALAHALGHLSSQETPDDDLAREWRAAESIAYGDSLPRARRDPWSGREQALTRLRAARAAFGQDWAVIRAPVDALADIGGFLRPRIALDGLPEGLESHWDSRR